MSRRAALDFVELAVKYGDLSNKHDLAGIRSMLHADAICYGFKGKDEIVEGMTNFRRQHDRVHWVFPHGFYEIASTDDANVRIEFFLCREWFEDGRGVQCTATEFIDFCSQEGLIKYIGYTKEPSDLIDAPNAVNTAGDYNKFIEAVSNPGPAGTATASAAFTAAKNGGNDEC